MGDGRENIDLLALALAYHRAPLAHQERLAAIAILPGDMNRLLRLANGAAEVLAAAARQTGAAASEIRGAALFLLQQLCFARDASHYRVLGLNPDATAEQIKDHRRLLMRLVHPDRADAADCWVDGYAARINEAYSVLSRPHRRAAYDAFLTRREPTTAVAAIVARPRFSTGCEAPRRRRPMWVPRARLPGLALGGVALAAAMGVAGFYPRPPPALLAPVESAAVVERPSTTTMVAAGGALAVFQAKPNWRALEPGERETDGRESPTPTPTTREPPESTHQKQLRIEQAELERLRQERILLERQLRATQLEMKRRRLEQLRAEQAQVERLRAERANAERLKLEQLRAEQVRIEELAELARQEPTPTPRLAELTPRQPSVAVGREPPESPASGKREAAARELTAGELDTLIERYADAYQSGDLVRLMALFDAQARGGSGKDRDRLRRDYAKFFDATQSRRLRLTPVRWIPRGTTADGTAHYQLHAVQLDGSTRDYEGSLRFEAFKRDARVLIRGIDFDIRHLK